MQASSLPEHDGYASMKSKSVLIILFLGFGAVIAFGLGTKFAFESNKGLQQVADFKSTVVRVCAARGVEEVTYKRLPKRTGVEIGVVAEASVLEQSPELESEIAEIYSRSFRRQRGKLRLIWLEPRFWGRSKTPYHESEFNLHALRARLAAEERRAKVAQIVAERTGLDVQTMDTERGGVRIVLHVDPAQAKDREQLQTRVRAAVAAIRPRVPLQRKARYRLRVDLASERAAAARATSGQQDSPPSGVRQAWAESAAPGPTTSEVKESARTIVEAVYDKSGKELQYRNLRASRGDGKAP